MLGVSAGTAEEFHSWCRLSAATLRDAAMAYAASGQVVSALADAWASDVAAMQAVIWGRLVIGSHSPQRTFFQAAEPIADAVGIERVVVSSYQAVSGTGVIAADAEMRVGGVQETITVTGESPVVLYEEREAALKAGVAGVDACLTRDEALPAFDLHCPLGSLPGLFRTTVETSPTVSTSWTATID